MRKKSTWTIAAAGIAALGTLVAGCTSTPPGTSSSSSASPTEGGKSGAGEKTITYQFLRNWASQEYPADGGEGRTEVLKAMEKAGITGFDFKMQFASGDDYNTKLNLLATSGQLPDLFDIDPQTLPRFVDQGLIQPLDEYLKKAPHLMKAVPEAYWKQVTFNGSIYAIPNGTRPEKFNFPTVSGLNIRQDWLDRVGLQKPATLDELYEVLKAFVTKDPDNNGKNDTIGLGVHKSSTFAAVFGAFGIQPTYWMERNGQIQKGLTLPEMKQALAVLQQWYKEGLIDHDFPIMEPKQMQEKLTNSITGLWDGDGYYVDKSGNSIVEALFNKTPEAKVAILEAPTGPDGKRGYAEANSFAASPLRALSAKAQDPSRIFQFLDWMSSEEDNGGMNLVLYGIEGKDYTYDKASNTIVQSTTYSDLYKRGYSNPIRMMFVTDRRWAKPPVRDAIEVVNKHLIKNEMWNAVPAELDYPDLEKKLYQEYLVKIITGVWPVDKYDEFIQKYYSQGGKEIEKQANELYKELNGK